MRSVFLLLAILVTFAVNAQTKANNVSGRVADGDGGAVWRATVALKPVDGDSTGVSTAVTDESGAFVLCGVADGRYKLTVTCVGYDDNVSTLTVNGGTALGTIRLKDSSEMLDEVTVMANYSEVKNNGDIIVRVKGNPLAKGKGALDFLRLVSGVEVGANGLSIRGRNSTLIYIGDERITFDYLRGIDPSMIARIEIIPHADASYGVNATGGVIKVHLREEAGLLGTAMVNSAVSADGLTRTAPRVTLLYSRGKLVVRNNLSGDPFVHNVSRTRQDETTADGGKRQTDTKSVSDMKTLTDNFSLKYSFSKLDRLDVYGGVSFAWSDGMRNSNSGTTSLGIASKGKPAYYGAGVQYKRWFGKDSLSYFHFRASYDRSNEYNRMDYTYGGTTDRAEMQAYQDGVSIRPVLHLRLRKGMSVNAGLDYYYLYDRHYDQGTRTLSYIPTGRYSNMGNDYGAWADFSVSFGNKYYLKAGLNYHGTKSDYRDKLDKSNNVSRWQDGLYPTLRAQWTIDKDKWRFIDISYRHAYSLPNYNYKVPTVVWQGENQYSIGNPDLKKQDYDMVEVYWALNRKFAVWYGFNYGDNLVNVMMRQDESRPGVYYTRPENTGWKITHSLGASFTGYLFKFWYTNTNLTAVNSRESMPGRRMDQTRLDFTSNNNFSVTKNMGVLLWVFARSKTKNMAYDFGTRYGTSAGVYLSLMKNKLNIDLMYNGIVYDYGTVTSRGSGWKIIRDDLSHNSNVQLYVTWNFNAGKKIKNQNLPSASPGSDRQIPTF